MTALPTLLLDFSGVYPEIGLASALLRAGTAGPVREIRLTGLEGSNCYCDPDAAQAIREAVSSVTEPVRWIDSGDYHYLTKLLAEQQREPFTLVLLDNHPDDQAPEFAGLLSCGSWVRALREENALLQEVVSIGPDGVFPASLSALDGRRVYISLDKDVLSPEWARTDWSQGSLSLSDLETILEEIFRRSAEVVAVDICGELSEAKGSRGEDQRINLATDLALQSFFSSHINTH